MVDCIVRNWQGKEVGTASLDLKVASQSTAADLVHRALVRQQANARQGTASTLTRAEVRGGGRKPYKQKGTGRARQGSIRTPLRPGGGIIFGPKPRSHAVAMNRKERRLALRTALMSRVDDIVAVKRFDAEFETPRTRDVVAALERWGIAAGTRVLMILTAPSEAVIRSVRNLPDVKLIAANQLNLFDLLNARRLVASEDALTTIQEVYGDG
ncbi:MAG: 50S ribosomal protein L4 [Aphanocapsa feldmannii 277cV]|uniref:Large ribosomal subunit protein uL4 n=2 Tax=Aphanocapsa feldmannii TaxID=192050 RepID=A0A524RMS4_9CHRO|nr:MAG: 50S ribosomal protein L4 [Aphanocapsa feldmannii 288cV]TGG91940.1 MAG: 50S ribosomal protein L4 [Aphanocapsa feldmannii 277cV]TGH28125.1 MAG: 50S ribosomal protein L4 [Aphanocapsa feldmannii 277cI]